jgi:hypothetical protein
MERFLYLPEDTDPTKMFDLKSRRGDFMRDFPTDSSDKYDDDHSSAGFDDEQDQQRFGSSEGTHQVDRQESSLIFNVTSGSLLNLLSESISCFISFLSMYVSESS